MKVIFIVNSRARKLKRLLREIDGALKKFPHHEVVVWRTEKPKHAIALAQKAVQEGCDYIIGAGGDGTLSEIVNGMMTSGVATHSLPPIGIVPVGSANDFVKTTGNSKTVVSLFELIERKAFRSIDIGKIHLTSTEKTSYFINIAGAGLGGQVSLQLEKKKTKLGPKFDYYRNIIEGFFSYKNVPVTVSSKEWLWSGRLLLMAISNGKYFGNALCIAPDANVTDGLFHITTIGNLGIRDYLKNLTNLKKGLPIRHNEVHYNTASAITLTSSTSCSLEADGEYIGLLPAQISVVPKAIQFLMPDHD